ncbi:MAG: hypothetical protein GWN86_19195, partial [Desulfobacterales bacterium]|nr:hypothetical protein [Desulfobacterales bacterium]
DSDQDWMNPYIIASAMKRADTAILEAAKLVYEGTFRDKVAQDKVIWLNLGNKGVWLSDEETLKEWVETFIEIGELEAEEVPQILSDYRELRGAQPAWIWNAIDELKAQIIEGKVEIPRPFGEPERWKIEDLREEYG